MMMVDDDTVDWKRTAQSCYSKYDLLRAQYQALAEALGFISFDLLDNIGEMHEEVLARAKALFREHGDVWAEDEEY